MEYVSIGSRVAVVTLPGHRALDREACLEALTEAKRLGSRIELLVLSLSEECFETDLAQLTNGCQPSAVIVCAPDTGIGPNATLLEESVAAALRSVWRPGVYLCAVGGAARILAEHGLIHGKKSVATEAHVERLRVSHPSTFWTTREACLQDGYFLSCSGMLASANAALNVLDLIGEGRLTYRIASRLMQLPEGSIIRSRPAPEIPLKHPALHRVDDLLARNPTHPWTSSSLARAVYVSERHLQRLFREVVGCGVLDYLQQRRLAKAVEILKSHPIMSLQKVAEASGFSSTQHMRRAWRKAHGANPSNLRVRSNDEDGWRSSDEAVSAIHPEKQQRRARPTATECSV